MNIESTAITAIASAFESLAVSGFVSLAMDRFLCFKYLFQRGVFPTRILTTKSVTVLHSRAQNPNSPLYPAYLAMLDENLASASLIPNR